MLSKAENGFLHSLKFTTGKFKDPIFIRESNKKIVLVSFKEITDKALNIIQNSLKVDGINLIEEYADDTKLPMIDNEMVQVILNIVKNSQDNFSERKTKNPQIKITARNNLIEICDNGGGISANIIAKIFDPYFSTKNEKNGTGLGLYMSKTIIEDHHKGTLTAYNQDDGVCFSITLPNEVIPQG
jgi:signal transduction histidine kinase